MQRGACACDPATAWHAFWRTAALSQWFEGFPGLTRVAHRLLVALHIAAADETMTGSSLELAALTKLYGNTVAVDAIDLKVPADSTTATDHKTGIAPKAITKAVVNLVSKDDNKNTN